MMYICKKHRLGKLAQNQTWSTMNFHTAYKSRNVEVIETVCPTCVDRCRESLKEKP